MGHTSGPGRFRLRDPSARPDVGGLPRGRPGPKPRSRGSLYPPATRTSSVKKDAESSILGKLIQYYQELEKHIEPAPPVTVQRARLLHVLVNLYRNAKEAMLENPEGQRWLTVELTSDREHVHIIVSDTGCGIPADVRERLFTHGFPPKPIGNGFGLHSCANYMADMGGAIRVESDGEGHGATFVLSFVRSDVGEPMEVGAGTG